MLNKLFPVHWVQSADDASVELQTHPNIAQIRTFWRLYDVLNQLTSIQLFWCRHPEDRLSLYLAGLQAQKLMRCSQLQMRQHRFDTSATHYALFI